MSLYQKGTAWKTQTGILLNNIKDFTKNCIDIAHKDSGQFKKSNWYKHRNAALVKCASLYPSLETLKWKDIEIKGTTLKRWEILNSGDYVFPSTKNEDKPLGRIMIWRILSRILHILSKGRQKGGCSIFKQLIDLAKKAQDGAEDTFKKFQTYSVKNKVVKNFLKPLIKLMDGGEEFLEQIQTCSEFS